MKTRSIKRIAVFCGSATGSDKLLLQECFNLAGVLHTNKIALVYGGGNVGLITQLN
jgi:predicted Rossmann-fold nucleotide-binding protein